MVISIGVKLTGMVNSGVYRGVSRVNMGRTGACHARERVGKSGQNRREPERSDSVVRRGVQLEPRWWRGVNN